MSCEREEIQEDSGTMCQVTAETGCVHLSPYVITLSDRKDSDKLWLNNILPRDLQRP